MGRESRQARRARERRTTEQQRKQASHTGGFNWSIIIGATVVVAAVAVLAFVFFKPGSGSSANTVPTPAPGKTLAGIGCNYMEQGNYHVHAHLTMLVNGKNVTLPAYVGFNYNHDCLYWTHTHDTSGIIHIEAPHRIVPTLGEFFAVWHKPLSRTQIAQYSVKPGEQMKVYVDQKPYSGNPADIKLYAHTMVTVEIGPPFQAPRRFNFNGL